MSKPVVFSLLAMVFYAITNVILEQKFSKFNNLTIMCVYVVPVLFVAFTGRWLMKSSDPSFDFPVGNDLWLLIAIGFLYAAADYFYIGAFTNGGSVITVTSIIILLPAVASLIKFMWTHSVPNIWLVSGYLLAAGAVILIAKGSSIQ